MEVKDEQAEPPVICLRFVNFILKSLSFKSRSVTHLLIRIVSAKREGKSEGEVVEADVGSHFETTVAVEKQEKLEGVGVAVKPDERRAKKAVSIENEKEVVKKQPVEMDSGSRILRPSKPVMGSTANINEKSHAFIQKRKESLRRGSSLQLPSNP